MAIPEVPATFTKFPASLGGPFDEIEIVGEAVDWEVELVAVIGLVADRVVETDAWRHVAGLTVGQDVSDRRLQFAAGMQFSLGKSRRGYGPMGPCVVTPDEVPDPDELGLGCSVDGEVVQDARTSDLIFSVPRLVADLSAAERAGVHPLHPAPDGRLRAVRRRGAPGRLHRRADRRRRPHDRDLVTSSRWDVPNPGRPRRSAGRRQRRSR
jgi:Fumarylacetoacetate (FAA) hydrolase family